MDSIVKNHALSYLRLASPQTKLPSDLAEQRGEMHGAESGSGPDDVSRVSGLVCRSILYCGVLTYSPTFLGWRKNRRKFLALAAIVPSVRLLIKINRVLQSDNVASAS